MAPVSHLASVEGQRLVKNPALWLALLATARWVHSARRSGDAEDRWFLLIGYQLLLPGFVIVVATVLAVLRARFSKTEELLTTCAVGPDRRSIAHSMAGLWVALLGVVGVLAVVIAVPRSDRTPWTPFFEQVVEVPSPNVPLYLQGPFALLAVIAFVVALVRWIPSWLVLVPLAFLLMVQGLFIGLWHGERTDGQRWLFPLNSAVVNGPWYGGCDGLSPCELPVSGFDLGTAWWHLGYLAALTVWFTVIAVLRHRRDRPAWTAFGVTTAAVLATALVQVLTATEWP